MIRRILDAIDQHAQVASGGLLVPAVILGVNQVMEWACACTR